MVTVHYANKILAVKMQLKPRPLLILVINIVVTLQVAKNVFSSQQFEAPSSHCYDFIIVGSGSAGSVLANRLSEVPNWRILLLEAGETSGILNTVPILVALQSFTQYNWRYFMEYQPDIGWGLTDRRMHWPRGRGLGGSSLINYMLYTRGTRFDYDRWCQNGNPGWSYQEVLPYFLKSENADNLTRVAHAYHNEGGYLNVFVAFLNEIARFFIEAGLQLGYPEIDYNADGRLVGFAQAQGNTKDGRRDSMDRAFLGPSVQNRPNLDIVLSAYVTKLLINHSTREAYGVEFEYDGSRYEVCADMEVILSAGAFNSPKLLMLAGIGPSDHLADLGIPLLADLPVGRNLQDHLGFMGLTFLVSEDITLTLSKELSLKSIVNYLFKGEGPLTCLGGIQAFAYIKTEESEEIEEIPDIELMMAGATLASDYFQIVSKSWNIADHVYDSLFRPIEGQNSFQVIPLLLHPKSSGFMKLRSTDPSDYPLFYGNYYSDPLDKDIRTMLSAIRFTIDCLTQIPAFKSINTTLNPNRIPGSCDLYEFNSDEYWLCALRSLSVTFHHQVGTVKMGPAGDPTAVVNSELKVHGIKRLRVADCSVIPFSLGAHTHAPCVMIGEKASDIIKQNWGWYDD